MQAPLTTTPAPSMGRIVASLALFSLLSACGLKGPLYMPPPTAASPAHAKPPAASAPANSAAPADGTAPAPANPVK